MGGGIISYCNSSDIGQVFGNTNRDKWADLDDDANAVNMAARIAVAVLVADDEIDDSARCQHYRLPLANAAGSTPRTIINLAATIAGLWLYEARGSNDFHPQTGVPSHRLAWKSLWVRRTLRDIRTGIRKIDAE